MRGQAVAEAVDPQPRAAEHRAADSRSDADRLVLRPVMRSASQQGMHVCSTLLEGLPADKPSSLADCNGQSAFSHIPDNGVSASHLTGPYAKDSSCMPTGAIALKSNSGVSLVHACWQHQLMHAANILPGNSKPVLQSPFAAVADMPIPSATSPMLSHQDSSAAPHYPSQIGPTQVGQSAAPQGACIGCPTGCRLMQASLPNAPFERRTVQFDSNQTARTDTASDAVTGPVLISRPPLSPSTLGSNGQGPLLQPAAKAQHSLAQSAPTALGVNATSSGRKRSYAHSQQRCLPPDMRGLHAVCQTELLPGRNVIVAAGNVNDLTQLQILPSKWCWYVPRLCSQLKLCAGERKMCVL